MASTSPACLPTPPTPSTTRSLHNTTALQRSLLVMCHKAAISRYGFVKFAGSEDRDRAIAECPGRPDERQAPPCVSDTGVPGRTTAATTTPNIAVVVVIIRAWTATIATAATAVYTDTTDPTNTTIYVGEPAQGEATEEEVLRVFSPCGAVASVRILPGQVLLLCELCYKGVC